jgi:hypothetical protein
MALREITRAVISLVEKTSGCPVVVSEDASLKTLAASRIARGANRIYSISFNPLAVREPDYLICYQCGFILRLFGIPAADRVDLAGRRRGVKACIGFLALSSRFKSSRIYGDYRMAFQPFNRCAPFMEISTPLAKKRNSGYFARMNRL